MILRLYYLSSSEQHASVRTNRITCHPTRPLFAQETHYVCNILRSPRPRRCRGLCIFFLHALQVNLACGSVHICIDRAWVDAVYGDAVLVAQFSCPHFGQPFNRGLGRGIDGLSGVTTSRRDRGKVDDAASAIDVGYESLRHE